MNIQQTKPNNDSKWNVERILFGDKSRRWIILMVAGGFLFVIGCCCGIAISPGGNRTTSNNVEVTRLVTVESSVEVEVTRVAEIIVTATSTFTPRFSPTPSDTPTITLTPSITPTPSKTPIPSNTKAPTSVAKPGGRSGYLWWPDDRTLKIIVLAEVHQDFAANNEQLALWLLRGEACLVEPGTKYAKDSSVEAPLFSEGIEVLSGACLGFRGWVPFEVLQANAP